MQRAKNICAMLCGKGKGEGALCIGEKYRLMSACAVRAGRHELKLFADFNFYAGQR